MRFKHCPHAGGSFIYCAQMTNLTSTIVLKATKIEKVDVVNQAVVEQILLAELGFKPATL